MIVIFHDDPTALARPVAVGLLQETDLLVVELFPVADLALLAACVWCAHRDEHFFGQPGVGVAQRTLQTCAGVPAVEGAEALATAQRLGGLLGAEMADGNLLKEFNACRVVHTNHGLAVLRQLKWDKCDA